MGALRKFVATPKGTVIPKLDVRIVDSERVVKAMLADLQGTVACDTETSRLYPFYTKMDRKISKGKATDADLKKHKETHGNLMPPHVVALQFGTKTTQWVIPMESAGIWTREQLESIVERITDRLEDCYLVGHNWKFDALWMRVRFGVMWAAQFDTMLAHYILDENTRHGLKELATRFLKAKEWDVDGEVKNTWSIENANYAAQDVYWTRKLKTVFLKKLEDDPDVHRVFTEILMPCVMLFVEAEFNGVQIDISKMDDAEKYLREELAKAEAELKQYEPKSNKNKKGKEVPFNWGSTQQVGRLLYDELGIKCPQKTKKGANSTSESALNQIDHPAVGALLKFRGHKQQLSFFIEGWKPYLDCDNRLHPSFKLHGTVTGRLSCENPNLQQVPRDPRIRTLITARDGYTLIEMDLSQIELRIAADMADEYNMLEAFRTGVDVHWLTAMREIERGAGMKKEIYETIRLEREHNKKNSDGSEMSYAEAVEYILEMGPELAADMFKEWKELRKKAKAINFGYLYGMWWKKFKIYARDNYGVTVTDKQAEASRKAFFTLYPKFVEWHKRQKRFARMNGYVTSLSGRKRRLPDAMSGEDSPARGEAERQAVNSPVQSFANELNLMAAIQMRSEFKLAVCRMVGTVHDACLFEVRDDWVERVHDRGLKIMSGPDLLKTFEVELSVPLEAEAKIGPWAAGVSLEKWKKLQAA